MKRIISLLVFVFVLNGCDDGNLTLENIDFENTTTQSCSANNLLFKLKENEALLLEIPKDVFTNEPTLPDAPLYIDINSNNRVVYRSYDGNILSTAICETIPPATPLVVDQWNGRDGKIRIITTMVKSTNETDNSTRITGYNHNIVFNDITFDKSNGSQVYETFPFGDYVTTATTLPFLFDKTKALEKCSTSNQIYSYTSSEALILDIDPNLILNEVTPLGAPRIGIIGTTNNKLTYRFFSGLLTPDYFCKTTTPATPVLLQQWDAKVGVSNVSGIVEVTSTTNGPGNFKHSIVLKKVTLVKGNSDFTLGDNYIYGDLYTTN